MFPCTLAYSDTIAAPIDYKIPADREGDWLKCLSDGHNSWECVQMLDIQM